MTLIVDGEPGASAIPGREAEECFPEALLHKVGPDLLPMQELEDAPLAADARETGDGKRGAKLKLAAALLGVGLDALVKRDDRRRQQRRRMMMSGMAASIALLIGLTSFAFVQRDAAVAAQAKAEAAEKDAKFQAAEAQGLVEFMLTDFRQELDSLGRLDVLERTGKRLLESFAKQDVSKLDANALGRRARVLLLLGEVDNTRGKLDAALARYKEASATTEELLRRNPESAQQIFDHAQSVYWVGYIAWQRGDAVLTKKQFTQYYDLAQQLVAIDPDKDEWRMEVNYAVSNLGTVAMDAGRTAEAETWFRKSLDIANQLASGKPNNVERLISAGQAYAWLADAQYAQSDIASARESRLSELELYQRAMRSAPENAALKERQLVTNYVLAGISGATADFSEALRYASAAVRSADELSAQEPTNVKRTNQAAFAKAFYSRALLDLRRTNDARAAILASIAAAEQLIDSDVNVIEWRGIILPHSLLVLAEIELVSAKERQAAALYRRVVDDLRPLATQPVADAAVVRRYCSALAGRARLSSEFEYGWTEIVDLLGKERNKAGPEALALLAEAYTRTGEPDEATAAASKLYAAGYRRPDFMALLEEFPELKPTTETVAAAR